MTLRNIVFFSLGSLTLACSSKEDEDTAALASEATEDADMVVAEDRDPEEGEEDPAEEEQPESIDEDDVDEEREPNDESTDEEESDGSESFQDGMSEEGSESDDEDEGPTDGVVTVEGSVLTAALPPTGTSGTLTVYSMAAPSGLIRDLDVKVDLDHSCSKDLAATLTSPSGTTIVLFDLRELVVCSSDMEDTLFDDEASVLITRGSTPFRGLHRPTGFLSDFDGEDAAGVWTLEILDDTVGDKGALDFWSLTFSLDER